MIACVAPEALHEGETLRTLDFASRAKSVTYRVRANVVRKKEQLPDEANKENEDRQAGRKLLGDGPGASQEAATAAALKVQVEKLEAELAAATDKIAAVEQANVDLAAEHAAAAKSAEDRLVNLDRLRQTVVDMKAAHMDELAGLKAAADKVRRTSDRYVCISFISIYFQTSPTHVQEIKQLKARVKADANRAASKAEHDENTRRPLRRGTAVTNQPADESIEGLRAQLATARAEAEEKASQLQVLVDEKAAATAKAAAAEAKRKKEAEKRAWSRAVKKATAEAEAARVAAEEEAEKAAADAAAAATMAAAEPKAAEPAASASRKRHSRASSTASASPSSPSSSLSAAAAAADTGGDKKRRKVGSACFQQTRLGRAIRSYP